MVAMLEVQSCYSLAFIALEENNQKILPPPLPCLGKPELRCMHRQEDIQFFPGDANKFTPNKAISTFTQIHHFLKEKKKLMDGLHPGTGLVMKHIWPYSHCCVCVDLSPQFVNKFTL